MAPPLLSVQDIDFLYGRVQALYQVSFVVHPGQVVTLLGSNGAGKSTTLRVIAGVLRPRTGSVIFNGEELIGLRSHQVADLGLVLVPEGRRIFSNLTVTENLEMGAFLVKSAAIKRGRFERVYSLFPQLNTRRHQLGGSLSGGEQQMLAIARAIMSGPKLLLLDEPSLGLGPLVVRSIFKVLRELALDGTTIVHVEQNARQALRLAEYAYVLDVGRISREGPAEVLLHDDAVRRAYLGIIADDVAQEERLLHEAHLRPRGGAVVGLRITKEES